VLKGEVNLRLRVASDAPRRERTARPARATREAAPGATELDSPAQERLAALKAWRTGVAREHNLPAYVVFHDATLAAMARERPRTLDELAGIGGVGAKKLQAYGEQLLQLLSGEAAPPA
jgi:ATP-dependent DNA helicase RecQ